MRTLSFVFLFLLPSLVHAQILFNEVTLVPTEERFIELYNSGDADVDLTGWYIQRKTATGSTFGSLVSSTKFENTTISAYGYFLIARSAFSDADIVLDTLSLTESNTLHLKNPEREIVDQVAWTTIPEEKSYQKLSTGEWAVGEKTPRAQNSGGASAPSPAVVEEGATTPVVIGAPVFSQNQNIAIDIGPQERVVLVGVPTTFEGRIEGGNKKPISDTQMKWSFGDGAVSEGWGITSISHVYHYEGEYNALLNLPAFFVTSPRVRVRVVAPEISLRVQGHQGRSAIVIENRMNSDLDITGWRLSVEGKTFTFPMTIIGARKSVAFSSEITLLTANEESHPGLFYANGVRVPLVLPSLSNALHASSSTILLTSTPRVNDSISLPKKIISRATSVATEQEVVPSVAPQQARVTDALAQTDYTLEKHNEKMWVWYASIFFLGALALAGFLLVRSKKTLADEFEIIDENE